MRRAIWQYIYNLYEKDFREAISNIFELGLSCCLLTR